MAIANFQPEVWAAQLLSVLRKSLVYANCANRNYEGDIAQYGDTVHIVSISDPTIGTYTKDTDVTVQVLTDADRTLLIDQSKYFAFEVDDIDLRQVRNGGGLMSEAADRAGFGLADVADQYLVQKMLVDALPANDLGLIDATTATNVYDQLIVPAGVKLNQSNVPQQGRWLVLDPAAYGKLQLDSRFIKVNEAGSSEALRNGMVGRAGGFDIAMSNNAFTTARAITGTGTVTTTGRTVTYSTQVFNQGDKGATIAGTRITGGTTIVSVNTAGTVATLSADGATAGTQTDTVLSGGGQVAIAGSNLALTYAEQISKVEAFRPQLRFADALKGLHLYGAKTVRPECLVVATMKVS